jgi:hypothetical protein
MNEIVYKAELRVPFPERSKQISKPKDDRSESVETVIDTVILLSYPLIGRVNVEGSLSMVFIHNPVARPADNGATGGVNYYGLGA